jgi:hypothetical protein
MSEILRSWLEQDAGIYSSNLEEVRDCGLISNSRISEFSSCAE